MTTRLKEFNVSVAEILGQPGRYREIEVAGILPEVRVSLARLEETPLEGRLRLESVVEGILVTGSVKGAIELECARCLSDFSSDIRVELMELFAAPGQEDVDEDAYRIQGTDIDLEPMLRDAITLDLPLNPLCREACKGLCARCGRDLNEGPCNCTDDDIDPRWAALDVLRDRLNQ